MVYRVLADGIDIYGSDTESSLLSPSLETELNSAGSLEFTLPPDHPSYDDISLMQTEIDVYEDDDLIFFGRPAEVGIDWNKQKNVVCEGALAYLNDAAIRPHKFEGVLISDVFKYIIAQYNAQVAQNKQFIVGNITITDRYVYTEFDYDICLSVLISTCIDSTGGYLFLRKEENGIYIDWLAEVPDASDQPVQFASNMLDLNQDTKAEDICTVVLPVGGQVDGVNITIAPVNQGSDILEDSDAIAKYGRILKIQQWNDIIDPQALKDKATEWLAKQQEDDITIETDAAELHYLDGSVGAYRIGQLVNVISGPHGVDKEYPILKMSMNLDSGTKRITLGTPPRKELTELSGITNSTGGGSSSGGGGGGGSTGVTDVLVNGSSVVSEHIARISAVTPQQLNDGLATKANQSDLNALGVTVAGKASQSDLNALSNTVSGKQDQLTPGTGISIDANNVISATGGGGTDVEANPSEPATDDLETIKIGDTVYDIPGGGSNTNYGKFTCDVLFVNDPLPSPTSGTGNVERTYTLDKSIDDYDAVYIVSRGYYTSGSGSTNIVSRIIFKSEYYSTGFDGWGNWDGTSDNSVTRAIGYTFTDDTHVKSIGCRSESGQEPVLYKIYGLKFENKLINRSDIYSEEERMIGRWTDGKPLYQKTWIFDNWVNFPNNAWTSIVNNVTVPFDYIVTCDGFQEDQAAVEFDMWFDTSSNSLKAKSLRTENETIKGFTLKYTKTTDTPGSGVIPEDPQMVMMSDYYSEDEQVVGRWTDGKPVYQKTWSGLSLTTNTNWYSTGIDVSFVDTLVDGFSTDTLSQKIDEWYGKSNDILYARSPFNNQSINRITLKYTKTTDAPGTGPTKGNLIYLPALYSEEEREVGVWTDGKPLYQKSLAVTLPSSNGVVCTFSANVDYMVDIHYHGLDTSNFFNANSSYGSTTFYYNKSNNSIYIDGHQSWMSGDSGYFTFQYTKTTDQPGSGTWTPEGQLAHHYSTSEKIVGTWIDGSTLYERTQNGGISISANDTWYDTAFTGVDKVISFDCALLRDGESIGNTFNNGHIDYVVRNNMVKIKGYNFSLADNFTLDRLTIQYTKSS